MKKLMFGLIGFASLFSIDTWESTDYIWNFGIIQACSVGPESPPQKLFLDDHEFDPSLYLNVNPGDLVWVRCRYLKKFYEQSLPCIQSQFVLIVNDGDYSFPSDIESQFDVEDLIQDDRIIHIFAQNCDYKGRSHKISHIPIGIDFHTAAYKGSGWGATGSPQEQETHLKSVLRELKPTSKRKLRAFVEFQHSDTMHGEHNRYLLHGEDRTSIFEFLLTTGLIDYSGFVKRYDLWRIKGDYAFSISPHGNGLDCHRTWEDLVLGCIVIVKTSPLDPLYEGLPVVIVKNWSEITEENMKKWLFLYGDAFNNIDYRIKLTNIYWLAKIKGYSLKAKY